MRYAILNLSVRKAMKTDSTDVRPYGRPMRSPRSRTTRTGSPWLRRLVLVLALVAASSPARGAPAGSGTIFVPPRHPVYEFLSRLQTKGFLPRAALSTKPWTRTQIAAALLTVEQDDPMLTATDRARWRYYVGEFADELAALGADSLANSVPPAWWTATAKDRRTWLRPFVTYRTDNAQGRIWVAGGFTATNDTGATYRRHAEIGGWLRLGEHLGMQGAMPDIAVWGDHAGPSPPYRPERGVAQIAGDTSGTLYCDDAEAMVTFGNRSGSVSIGQYPLVIGPGRSAQVTLSDKAPAAPQVRLSAHPWPWLTFTYVHLSLQSGVPDTAGFWHRQFPEATGYVQKYYVAHRLEFTGIRGVDLGLGESVVYGGRGPVLRYLIPVMPLRPAQHAEGDLDNLQMWGDIAVTRLPRTKLYGALLIDELSLDALFTQDNIHNWWAWQIGAYVADTWGFAPDLDFGLEYTRAHPWVYRHKYPWNTYDTWAYRGNDAVVAYPLGFWQGHNGDFIVADLVWRPRPGVRLALSASQARRGGDGTMAEQYNPPAEPFLFGPVTRTREARLDGEWETARDLFLRAGVGVVEKRYVPDDGSSPSRRRWTALNVGVTYNVW